MLEKIPIATILVSYVAVLFALSVHEAAHATAAYLLDDDTAARRGRMTINPLAHMDFLGTFLLPLLGMIGGVRVLGWAKPVPVDVRNLTRRFPARVGYALVAAAGPASNLVQAMVFLAILAGLLHFVVPVPPGMRLRLAEAAMYVPVERFLGDDGLSAGNALALTLLGRLVAINIGLAVFNLLPVGPLDGAGILRGFLPWRYLPTFDRLQQPISIGLLICFFLAPGVIFFLLSPFYWVVEHIFINPLARLLIGA